jgi:hypothetical protein
MTEAAPERRDLQSLMSDMRVDVAAIKTRVEVQTGALARLENKLDLGIFREEYERRHRELEAQVNAAKTEADEVRDESLKREGAGKVWRVVFTAGLGMLGLIEAVLHH